MGFIHEIQVKSSGYPGAPGYTNFYFKSAIADDHQFEFAAVFNFLASVNAAFPSLWSAQIATSGRMLEETTGTLGAFTTTPGTALGVVQGSGGASFGAGVAGACIGWSTATLNRARLVRGRTFLVPLVSTAYGPDGTLSADILTLLNDASLGLIASNTDFAIWSRPRLGVGGLAGTVLQHRVTDKAAFLSSRRD